MNPIIEPLYFQVNFEPRSPPRCPTPDMGQGGIVIAIIIDRFPLLKIIATNHKKPLIVRVSMKKFIAKTPKIRMGKAIVFEDDSLFFLFKEPIQSRTDRPLTAQIGVSVEGLQTARPIHGIGNALPNFENRLLLTSSP
ncbi:MAG: hypothetical protein FJ350_06810 [Sphingomonadales bacterium]|nr:hypothetical protein [Sphingomonadales bacterium]